MFTHELLSMAQAKQTYHSARAAAWQEMRDEAEQDLRDNGFEIRQHQVTGGVNTTAVLDPEKSAWLATCESKRRHHMERVVEYRRWCTMFERSVDVLRDCDPSDLAFFGFGEPEPEADD